ncbi:MAG TPA: biosynthetic-type acetolactate synthase large subunit [Aggregatilinea sp.]|uniref:biosynthetic-type acetolactate synthase large subunit n=1 Tax=Aggregatilinea sp. TaxID=2806333 RepID=UPI002BECB409|nr:biosynthetic-type acetolactate synthase large subunit [Aggregatilinea sp.]HML23184.1 biosynthetic-type acetolactate synthase large subunit [Aggregatilinea sp.]
MKLTGAEIIMECLMREGVETIYGYPGGAILPFYDALSKYPQIHHVLTRHEQGAAHMADGFARATGKVGVAIGTSGPGATNLVTGIATAMMDSSPIVCITGQVASSVIGTDAFQEVDVTGVTLPITKHSYLVYDVEELAYIIREAFHIARTGRPGPVLIDVPKDVQNAVTEFEYPEGEIYLPGYKPPQKANADEIQAAMDLIQQAQHPVILAGHGVLMSGATAEVIEFAERTQTPIALTLLGKGGVPESHPLSLGMMGMHGTGYANLAIQDADLLLAFGMRFDDRVTGNLKTYAPNAKKIHIDIDASEIHKNVHADVPIVGDLKTVLNQLLPALPAIEHREWLAQIRDWMEDADERDIVHQHVTNKLLAAHVIRDMWVATQGNAIVVTDVGQHQMWEAQYYLHERPHTLITSGGLGTMGFGLPAAIGASMGLKTNDVWLIAGDGGFQMTMSELATAVQEHVPVKIAIINNGYLGMVRQWQEFFYEERYNATPMITPDFVKLADAYGIPAKRVTQREDVIPAMQWAETIEGGPVLLEFVVEKHDIVYPMVPAGADLHNMIRRPVPSPEGL